MKMKNVADLYPLSPMQQAMLAHALYAPASRVSFEQSCDRLQGKIDRSAFMQAWMQVMKKHAVLRTAMISKVIDEPLQVVYQQLPLPLQQYDWRNRCASEQEEALENLLQADRAQGFVLDKAPLMRLMLIQIADDAYYFVWSFHHIILDGWSKAIITNDFLACYHAALRGCQGQAEHTRPYRDYIAWLQQQDQAKTEQVWRQELQGFTKPTRLSLTQPASAPTDVEQHEEHRILCSTETTAALRALAHRSQITLNVLMQSAWSLFLYLYSGNDDVVFGATVSGRPLSLAGSNAMVGLFINILPVRVHIPGNQSTISLKDWMQEIQAKQLALDAVAYTPLVHIQECSDVPWNQTLFESLLVFENYASETIAAGGDAVPFTKENVYGASETTYPLTIVVEPAETLMVQMAYDRHFFSPQMAERITADFHLLLQNIAACAENEQVATLLQHAAIYPLMQMGTEGTGHNDSEAETVPPRTPLEFQLVQMWEEILHVHPIGVTDDFFALGGHSLSALRLAAQLRKEFQQSFPISLLAQSGTVRQLAQVLQQQGTLQASPIVALQKGSGMPFFCIHPGSGNILCYYQLVRHLDSDQPFYAIHDLDIHAPEFPEVPIAVMADRYVREMRKIQPNGPYALGGFSFGGIVAFEMAQQLYQCGQQVRLLVLLDSGSPFSTQGFENEDNAGFLSVLTMEAIRTSSQKTAEEVYDDLRVRTRDEQLRYVVEQMIQAGFEPPENGPLGVEHELHIYQTRTKMIQQYSPHVYPGGLTLFQAQEHDTLAPTRSLEQDWQRLSCQPLEVYAVPGYHDTLLDELHVQVIAEKLQLLLKTFV